MEISAVSRDWPLTSRGAQAADPRGRDCNFPLEFETMACCQALGTFTVQSTTYELNSLQQIELDQCWMLVRLWCGRILQHLEYALFDRGGRDEVGIGALKRGLATRGDLRIRCTGQLLACEILAHATQDVKPRHIDDFRIVLDAEE